VRYSRNLTGVTIQVRVPDAELGFAWYEKLLGRPPDFEADATFKEWELVELCWLQVAKGEPAVGAGPLRLGVGDVERERTYVQEQMGVEISEVERLEGVAAWCSFSDPFGNQLGLFEDLAESPHLRDLL
jgi:catechol 2,3-dioxygenase-like lactoylglutathione lyase family enzyme